MSKIPMPKAGQKAAVYIRLANEPKPDDGIKIQEERMREFAIKNGHYFPKIKPPFMSNTPSTLQ